MAESYKMKCSDFESTVIQAKKTIRGPSLSPFFGVQWKVELWTSV